MDPTLSSIAVVIAQVSLILIGGVLYLRHVRVDRPPVGVFNARDVLIIGAVLVVIPPVYLSVPIPVVGGMFALVSTGMLYFSLSPVLGGRRAGLLAIALVIFDVALAEFSRGGQEWLFLLVNNLALAIVVVGVCNIWVQSGIRARHVALLACALAVYDVIATLALPLMSDFLDRVSSVPLTPILAWGHGTGQAGIGLGDLLLLLVWTLVAEKAFSRGAGLVAAAIGLSCVAGLFVTFWVDLVNRPLPAMVLLGPIIGLHYVVLARRYPHQRTTAEYFASPTERRFLPQRGRWMRRWPLRCWSSSPVRRPEGAVVIWRYETARWWLPAEPSLRLCKRRARRAPARCRSWYVWPRSSEPVPSGRHRRRPHTSAREDLRGYEATVRSIPVCTP